jgi:hypothetical protein
VTVALLTLPKATERRGGGACHVPLFRPTRENHREQLTRGDAARWPEPGRGSVIRDGRFWSSRDSHLLHLALSYHAPLLAECYWQGSGVSAQVATMLSTRQGNRREGGGSL